MRTHFFPDGKSCIRHSGGFTLLEIIISIVLIGILAAVGSTMISDSFKVTQMVDADTASQQQARYALERLVREIREVKYSSGVYAIGTMTSSQMAFTKTVNGADIAVTINYDNPNKNLTLQYSSGPPATSTLTNQATAFTLGYRNASDVATSSTSAVSYVVTTLGVTDPTSGQLITQRMRATLRNK